MNAYFEWDGDGVIKPLGAWPNFDSLPRTRNSVWIFEGVEELEDFVDQALKALEDWKGPE